MHIHRSIYAGVYMYIHLHVCTYILHVYIFVYIHLFLWFYVQLTLSGFVAVRCNFGSQLRHRAGAVSEGGLSRLMGCCATREPCRARFLCTSIYIFSTRIHIYGNSNDTNWCVYIYIHTHTYSTRVHTCTHGYMHAKFHVEACTYASMHKVCAQSQSHTHTHARTPSFVHAHKVFFQLSFGSSVHPSIRPSIHRSMHASIHPCI